ncbi:MAG: two-component regulator propeller domain-containing protein, partial [Gammaproteobacteria bacterium]
MLTLQFATVFAQSQQIDTINEVTYQFNQLSTERGLIDNRIKDIIQDRAGFIWLANDSGLVRYDGHRYQNYFHNVKIPTSLSSNEVTTLLEDSKGRLWVGTSDGLNRQLGHSIDFNRYFSVPESAQTLADNYIVDIAEDQQGRLWVATRTAVNLYDERTGTFARYFFYDSNSGLNAQIDQIVAVGEEIYVSSSSGLFRYLSDDGIFYRYGTKDGLPNDLYTVTTMSQIDNDNLLVAVSNGGLFKLAADTGQFAPLTSINSQLEGILETLEISALYIHPETQQIWLGTVKHGLYILNQDMTDLIKVLSSNADEFSRFEQAGIQGIFSDDSGLVWIYTRQAGINQWSSHTLGIEHYGSRSSFTDGGQLRTYIWY